MGRNGWMGRKDRTDGTDVIMGWMLRMGWMGRKDRTDGTEG